MNEEKIIEIRKSTPSDHTRPWGDSINFAKAILNERKLVGWFILDKDDFIYEFRSLRDSSYGSEMIRVPPTKEMLDYLDREWAGMAPFSFKEAYM